MIGYKLFRKMKDGYAPLFINKRQRLHIGVEYPYEDHPTKGYARRPGWHICEYPIANHLSQKPPRVWVKVKFTKMSEIKRPAHQGSKWFLGSTVELLEEIT